MKKIIVIDDEIVNRLLIISILKSASYEVYSADGGKNGINLAKELRPNLIICDFRMPGIDGMEVLEMIRADKKMKEMPFIFLTSNIDFQEERVALKLGANAYLHKPVDKEKLLECVKKYCK